MNTKRRVLAIGAHPDDIEIACGATLAKMHDIGYEVFGLILSRGEQGGDAAARVREAIDGANSLGLDRVEVLDFSDTRFSEHSLYMLAAIEAQLNKFQPDLIFTHSRHDFHQDHVVVNEATLRATRNHTSILCYESPSASLEFKPSIFVDVKKYVHKKIVSIQKHNDQLNKAYTLPEQILGRLIFRGSQARVEYAEGFEVIRLLSLTIGGF